MSRGIRYAVRHIASLMALMVVLLAAPWCGARAQVGPGQTQGELGALPLTFPVQSPEVAAFFNQIARPSDIASFPTAVHHLLPQVTAGQRMAAFSSWADAESRLDALADKLDWVMYNPEHWEMTPAGEQADLVATVRRAHGQAHDRGLRLMLAPDRRFADASLRDLAPHVDALLLQGQRLQADPAAFAAWITAMAEVARAANPQVLIFAQVGATQGTAQEMAAALEAVTAHVDGIAVWSMPRTLPTLKEFVEQTKRPLPSITPAASTPTVTSPGPTPLAAPSPSATPSPTSSATPAAMVAAPTEASSTPYPPTAVPTIAASPRTPAADRPASTQSCLAGISLAAGGLAVGVLIGSRLWRHKMR